MSPRSANTRLKVLLLCDFRRNSAGTIIDYIQSFKKHSKHAYTIHNGLGDSLACVNLRKYDAIFIHWTLVACNDNFVAPATRRRIRSFGGYKAVFIQDDYRFIDRTVEALAYLRIHALFSIVGQDIIDDVYSPKKLPGVKRVTVLTGYVPDNINGFIAPAYESRSIDVGYRARKVPMWLGSHTLQKWQIADRFTADAGRYGLVVDISTREEDRVYGEAWIKFLSSCKAMLGTESGASVCDFTGQIQENVESYTAQHPDASFEELRDRFFKNEDCRLTMNLISPRCFEAAALKTLMILYEGEYSGVLRPWKHYVPLKRDHGNMAQILEVLRDPERAGQIVERAYEDIVLSGRYGYPSMVNRVDSVMEQGIRPEMLAVNRPRCTMRQRIANGLRSSKIGSVVWSVFFADSEITRIRHLKSFFSRNHDAEAHIYINPAQGTLELVAVPSGSDPLPNAKREIDKRELRELLLSTKIRSMRWLNNDPLGLGAGPLFENEFHFLKISLASKTAPMLISDLIGARSPNTCWFRRAFVVDRSIWSDDSAGGCEAPPPPLYNPVTAVLKPLIRKPVYGIWGRLPSGVRVTLKPGLKKLLRKN